MPPGRTVVDFVVDNFVALSNIRGVSSSNSQKATAGNGAVLSVCPVTQDSNGHACIF